MRWSWLSVLVVGVLFVQGCASVPVVQPTFEEYEAVKTLKKTVAVTDLSEVGSSVSGINQIIISKLEGIMVDHFNVVERKKLDPIMHERQFQAQDNVQSKVQIGQILGADFVIYGSSVASFVGPNLKSSSYVTEDGAFVGQVWEEFKAIAEVNIKVVDVKNGVIHSSIVGEGEYMERMNHANFSNPDDFNRASRLKLLAANGAAVEETTSSNREQQALLLFKDKDQKSNTTKISAVDYSSMNGVQAAVLSRALDRAVKSAGAQFMERYGVLDAQVLQIVSDKEVMLNIGSAFGVKPGQKVTVWSSGSDIIDPRTGLNISPRVRIGTLKVTQVSSGLASVAKGSPKVIREMRVGDYVTL